MREILTISLPPKTTQVIKKKVKDRGFGSISGYIKYLLNLDEDLISEEELWQSVQQARQDYKQGKIIKAESLTDLL